MRVTVIGGTGNVGSATVARLARDGHDVIAAARRLPHPDRIATPKESIHFDTFDPGYLVPR